MKGIRMTLDQATALRLLREALAKSELTASDYARQVLIRGPRTMRRWLSGESPIPEAVRDYLEGTTLAESPALRLGDSNTTPLDA